MFKFFRLFYFIIFIFFLSNCSFKDPSGFFEDRLKELEAEIAKKNSRLVFSESKKFREEIAGLFEGKIEEAINNSNWPEKNFTSSNHVPHLQYKDSKRLIYKSKKIGKNKFDISDLFFEPIIFNQNIFFYDPSGNVYNFSTEQGKLLWKFNFYKKRFKNLPIQLKLKISNKNLIVSDNLGYLYALESESGNLVWAKNYGVPFRSTIKTGNENIFLLNQDNKFYIINKENGEMKTSFETFPSLLKSEQETSISLDLDKNNLYFVTSTGQFYSVNYKTNNLNWLLDLSTTKEGQSSGLFFSSPIIHSYDKLFVSNSVGTYSIDSRNGKIYWELPFSTNVRPIVLENFLILASKEGFILSLDSKTGKVIWSKNLFNKKKKLKQKKIGSITSLLLVSNKILATTSKGFFFFIDYKNGEVLDYTKASRNGFFSIPVLVDKNIYVIDNKIKILIFD